MKNILFILLGFLAVSCSKQSLADLNKDVKNPSDVPGNTLFSNAEKNLSDQDVSLNVNHNDFDLWSQYLTETTYTDEANYNIFTRNVPDYAWTTYYRDILENLQRADSLIRSENTTPPVTDAFLAAQKNRLAIIDILACYAWDQMETTWGNIPYSEALNIQNVLPKYDDALTIHKDLISRVTTDIAALDPSNASFGDADLIYSGDVSLWKEFGNGLLIKMAIEIANVSSESTLVKTTIQNAMAGTFASSNDDAIFDYLSSTPNTNPLYVDLVLSGRSDYVAANTIINKMDSLNDPRLSFYFDQNLGTNTYLGGTYGNSSAFPNYTHINTAISNTPSFPHAMMTYSEIQFYLAEAAARGIISGDASTYFNDAVTASIVSWGGTTAQAATYLAQPTVAYNASNWAESIGTQAWISFYLRGYLGWTEWRRLGYPAMNEPPHPATGVVTFPYRYPYPSGEQTLNPDNYTSAAKAIGGDLMSTKLYWEK
ncbi:SusD/RagB family nutrient-binding outer membrane lipoprotein [Microbacter margulisiae]|uniref:Starch-binding associating with outer membrane n=1 Tax=Microbacter margulisiae TaxID=1350067 RepID=A0A7W5DU33_9PORP|nr:SusD/RagB family nutrient-binding outer membrane lipoprotein [Microbacter margulisiae]MBB3188730.1 hypothetical protein [Microbacter margulisiae]